MPVPAISIDESGIHAPDYQDILLALQADYRRIFGDDVYIEPDSQDGELLAIVALAISDAYSGCIATYLSFSPHTAQGVGLSQQVKINGIARLDWSYSSVDLRLVGQPGTVILNGIAQDTDNQRWLLPGAVVIPVNGEVTVTATAENPGDVRAPAHTVTIIATPTRGWQTVENKQDALVGRPVESDAQLRRRQDVSTSIPSLTVFEGTIGAVASVEGVTRWRGYENDTNETDENGIPAHTICMVVEGGDAQNIADRIAAKKTPGTGTYGSVAVPVVDEMGVPNTIKFERPVDVALSIEIRIQALPGYLSTTGDMIRQAVADYVNAVNIGDNLWWSKLFVPANLCNVQLGTTYDVLNIGVSRSGGTPRSENVETAFNEAVSVTLDTITLTVA